MERSASLKGQKWWRERERKRGFSLFCLAVNVRPMTLDHCGERERERDRGMIIMKSISSRSCGQIIQLD